MKKRIEKLTKEELDRLVAEKVMHWHLVTDQIGSPFWADSSNKQVAGGYGKRWSPSTRIEQAWMIGRQAIKLCTEKKFYFALIDILGSSVMTLFTLDNAPELICRAALKAICGEEVNIKEKK